MKDITRRLFIKIFGSLLGGFSLTNWIYPFQRLLNISEGSSVDDNIDILYAIHDGGGCYRLSFDNPNEPTTIPEMTYWEYFDTYVGEWPDESNPEEVADFCYNYSFEPEDLIKICPEFYCEESYLENYSPSASAFYYLNSLDLGEGLDDQLSWHECDAPGHPYVGVEIEKVEEKEGLELIKAINQRLAELGELTVIKTMIWS